MAETVNTYTGNGAVAAGDFHEVKWVGKTKAGSAVTITMDKAINMGNLEWTFAEKNDVVPSVTFEGVYTNTDAACESTAEPWSLVVNGTDSGAASIVLGAGIFYIDDVAVALTRGGGSFTVEREFREINADGDRGAVEGRVVIEASRPKLTMNVLTMITRVDDLWAGITKTTT